MRRCGVAGSPPPSDDDTLPVTGRTSADGPTVADAASAPTALSSSGIVVVRPPGALHERVVLDPRRYEIRGELARGGMGRVSVGEDRALGRPVAIKEILGASPELVARFERELALTARLQHPGIVTVHEGGVWPTGEAVYVMRLVSGTSLDATIKATPTFAQRLALLPHVIAATDALAYAHAQGIIHRDLKPANVMLGDFGETVVIDWGLAKDLRAPAVDTAPDAPAARISSPSASSSAATVAGDVLGTPAYMAPEQARGQDVDERADVYALGAVLYHVLAGVAPFRGSVEVALAQVLSGPPAPLAGLVPDAPPDLIAIVARAMAAEPSARYATAAELGAELKRFQRGKLVSAHQYTTWELVRRWVRRRRAVVAVSASAVLVLAVVGAVSVRRIVRDEQRVRSALALAEISRAESERRGADTERLLDFLLFRLHGKLEGIGRLDILEDATGLLRDYYASHPAPAGNDDVIKRALARRNLGDVLRGKGESSAAVAEYRAAAAVFTNLATRNPAEIDLALDLVVTLRGLGDLLADQGDLDAALALTKDALTRTERAFASAAAGTEAQARWRRSLVVSHVTHGSVLEKRRQHADALLHYRAATTLAQFSAATDADPVNQRLVSQCHERVGDLLLNLNDLESAGREYKAALAIDTALAAADPDNALRSSDLRFSYLKNGDYFLRSGDTIAATAMYRSAMVIARALVARDPQNTRHMRELAYSHVRLGDALAAPETVKQSIASHEEALALRTKLVARDPSNAGWRADLLQSLVKLGMLLEADEQNERAHASYQAAWDLGQRLLVQPGQRSEIQRSMLPAVAGLASIHLLRGELDQALAWRRAELAQAEEVLAGPVKDRVPNDYWPLVLARESTAEVLIKRGDRAEAEALLQGTLTIVEERVTADPSDLDWPRKRDAITATLASLRRR